tara:strand:- start:181 stop:462 length:282 start_codon:yes stop_codon:yes gene_type:complete
MTWLKNQNKNFPQGSPVNGSPLHNNEEGEIRPASEVLGDQPGYNPKTNKVMQTGTVNTPKRGTGTAMAAATGLYGLGMAAWQGIKNWKNKKNK